MTGSNSGSNARKRFALAGLAVAAVVVGSSGASLARPSKGDTGLTDPGFTHMMATPRFLHSSVTLADGRVLIAGGAFSGDDANKVQSTQGKVIPAPPANSGYAVGTAVFDPAGWANCPSATGVSKLDGKATSVGQVTIDGSAAGQPSTTVGFTGDTCPWSDAGDITGRTGQTATLLADGTRVLVAGGRNDQSTPVTLADLSVFDSSVSLPVTRDANGNVTSANPWSAGASLATGRYGHVAALLPSGNVLIAGGASIIAGHATVLNSAEIYNPATNTVTAAASMATGHLNATATTLADGRVLVVGGADGSAATPSHDPYGRTAEIYSEASNTWTAAASLPHGATQQTATLIAHDDGIKLPGSGNPLNGTVLVAGGLDTAGALADSYLYDPIADGWLYAGSFDCAEFDPTWNVNNNAGQATAPTYPASCGRYGHQATLANNGTVVVTMGNEISNDPAIQNYNSTANSGNGPSDTITVWDPTASDGFAAIPDTSPVTSGGGGVAPGVIGSWVSDQSVSTPLYLSGHGAALIGGTSSLAGSVLITGGLAGGQGTTRRIFFYNPGK